MSPEDLERVREPPAAPGNPSRTEPVGECLRVIRKEAWLHSGYADPDLAVLGSGGS